MRDKLNNIFKKIFSEGKKLDRSNFNKFFDEVGFFSKEQKLEIERILGVNITHFAFFEQAFTHRSYLHIAEKDIYSNERLEFLGDSILGMIIAEYLFLEYDVLEGDLTKLRADFVNKKSLSHSASQLKLQQFILMSFSAEKALETGSESILADTLEAIIAAIYLDSGLDAAKRFVINKMIPILTSSDYSPELNFKSKLLEIIQAEGKEAPTYEVLEEKGPDHDKIFKVGVYSEGNLLGKGKGKNKKSAEQRAAESALKNYNRKD